MRLKPVLMCALCFIASVIEATAQSVRAVPRPPAPAPGPPRPEDGSAAPDGYAQIPEWMGPVRLVLKDDRIVAEQRLLTELNTRIRGVAEGLDGALYVLTDGANGRVLRLVPKH